MHRAILLGEAAEPSFLHGEGQDRRKPGGEAGEDLIHHRAGGAAAQAVRRIAIKGVLADVEVERRQLGDAEIGQRVEDAGEVVGLVALAHQLVELGQAMQHEQLKAEARALGRCLHVLKGDALAFLEACKIAEQEADRVAQLAVTVRTRLDDVGADNKIVLVVGAGDPDAEDLGAGLLDDLFRRHGVLAGLRHLLAGLVQNEAVGYHLIIRRAATGAAAFKQGRLEPAAMLVGAFKIECCGPGLVLAAFQHEGVGGA